MSVWRTGGMILTEEMKYGEDKAGTVRMRSVRATTFAVYRQ